MKKNTTGAKLAKMKSDGIKISALTAYDASFAGVISENGVDVILVGDSLGMVLQGSDSTIPVTVDDICYHTRCVNAGNKGSLIIGDMPFMSYSTKEQAWDNAAKIMKAGANMVKLEGGKWLLETIAGLTERGIPVCAHLGLTPQSVNVFGGYKVQGREDAQADLIVEEALAVQAAGAQLLVVECIPTALSKRLSEALIIPVIGIGAGVECDGQILVMHDLLGISSGYIPKFSKNYMVQTGDIHKAIAAYVEEVGNGSFPAPEHSFD
ncbi:3-methyl-2-oxobutanoate hydroxymethyltransferase [Psychrobium sp. MM17-31]|uniref:3-methyl-2-oxobutanoate hydroxymethyltransferase n=1 Tax=Psychrobium sp. MM17-31 TaxID=2917758 RepID=UPI001EF52D4A|nr:3-methyl-2-oxobutanoate hydroxymethyltransferase [Psychrobium sp. MM17-31]MCG7530291.1 3-methyl-2-oxobutanoate hydroxymethyltransferase [Psychrobium sp. MM17-31]